MQDDRFQMPERVEKAFEYLKQAPTPTDFELSQQRARTWEQVVKRGRRFATFSRWWKPAVGVLTTAVVVLLAVNVPHFLHAQRQVEIGNMSAPKPKTPSQAYYDKQNQLVKLYQEQGKRYIASDVELHADLVEVSDPKKNFNTLEVVKDGVAHEVFSYPKTKKAQESWLGKYLIGFTLMDTQTRTDDGKTYMVNTQQALQSSPNSKAVKSIFINHSSVPVMSVVKQGNKLSVLYNEINQNDRTEELVEKWDWDSEKKETVYRSTGKYLEGIIVLSHEIVLSYQKQAVLLTDQGTKMIDNSDQGINLLKYGTDETDIVYTKGQIAGTAYGSYHGDVQINHYDLSKAAPVPLLPGVQGDQLLVGAPPDDQYLIENFVADDPVQAQSTAVTNVAGTLQFWYVKRGEQPKLVYSQKRSSEEFFVSVNMLTGSLSFYLYPDPMNGTLLLTPYYNREDASGFSFDWKTHKLEEIKNATH